MSAPLSSSGLKVRENADQRSPSALAAVRVALAQPFADPVNVGGIPMRRAEARALERLLTSKPARRSQDATLSMPRTSGRAVDCAGEGSLSSTALPGAFVEPSDHDRPDAAAECACAKGKTLEISQ